MIDIFNRKESDVLVLKEKEYCKMKKIDIVCTQ